MLINYKFGNNALYKPANLFVISDVHAEAEKLESIISQILLRINPEDHIVFVGDIIGNKRSNIKTFFIIEKLIKTHANTFIIEGNHESNFINYLNSHKPSAYQDLYDPVILKEFLDYGAISTKPQHIIELIDALKITFMHNLIPYYETEDILITHSPLPLDLFQMSGTSEGVLDNAELEIRHNFIKEEEEASEIKYLNKWSISGHQNNMSKRKFPDIYPDTKKIFLDCGCGYYPSIPLFALDFNNMTILKSEDKIE